MAIYAISKAIIWTRSASEPAWEAVNAVLVGRISEPTFGLNAESAECDAKVGEGESGRGGVAGGQRVRVDSGWSEGRMLLGTMLARSA